MTNFSIAVASITILAFNLPVIVLVVRLPLLVDLGRALKDKDPVGGPTDTTSYSRVTGLVGAVILTAFFWALGNIAIFKAFTQVSDIQAIVNGVGPLFVAGAAMFLPYAFNQVKSAFGAAGAASAGAIAAPRTTAPSTPLPAAVPAGLNLVVANLSTSIDDATFSAAVAAIGLQVSRDFQPQWGSGGVLTAQRLALGGAKANIDGAADAIIYVGDSSSDPTTGVSGAFGYHSTNFGQLPYAFVYLDVCAQYGEVWTCTLSHETLELLADPAAVLTVAGPAPASAGAPGQTVSYDLEVCDPTQGDSYAVNGVTVSNFVTKAYFGMPGGSSATNYLALALSPLGVRPGGYFQYEDSTGAHPVNGPKVDAARLAARAILAGYRRNARRAEATKKRI